MLWHGDNSDRSATRFFFFLLKMRKRNIGIATGSSIFWLLSHYAVKDAWTGGLSRFLLLFRYAVKETWITRMFIRFVNVLYREHKYQSTSDGQKSHLCFHKLIIGKRPEDGLVPNLFSQLNDTKRESKGRHIQNRLFFCFFLIWCCKWKMKIGIADHISIFPFLFLK